MYNLQQQAFWRCKSCLTSVNLGKIMQFQQQQVSTQQTSTQQSYEPIMKTDHKGKQQQKKDKPKFDRAILRQVKRNQIEVLKKFH